MHSCYSLCSAHGHLAAVPYRQKDQVATMTRSVFVAALVATPLVAAPPAIVVIDTPMPAPAWARLERQLLADNVPACREFFEKYYDARGYLQAFLRWGANDGPDDAFENFNRWPELHALGGGDDILRLYLTGWEGMIRQYSEAKTTDVPAGRAGMYVRDFSAQSDWMHHGEGLQLFNRMALSAPGLPAYRDRARRFAALYMGEDPEAPNYDPGQEADPLDDQRQPRPDAASSHGARLGRRPIRCDGVRRTARREHLRAVPRALPRIHRRRRRSLPEPRRHDPSRPTPFFSPARPRIAAGLSNTWTPGSVACGRTAASSPASSTSTARSAGPDIGGGETPTAGDSARSIR